MSLLAGSLANAEAEVLEVWAAGTPAPGVPADGGGTGGAPALQHLPPVQEGRTGKVPRGYMGME